MIPAMEKAARDYLDTPNDADWPGPNCNTFVRYIIRNAPSPPIYFDHNAIGKDFTRIHAGFTATQSGLQSLIPGFWV